MHPPLRTALAWLGGVFVFAFTLLAQTPAALPPVAATDKRVLELDGKGSFVELPPDILRGLEAVTVEGWVRWDDFGEWSRFFSFGEGSNKYGVFNNRVENRLSCVRSSPDKPAN